MQERYSAFSLPLITVYLLFVSYLMCNLIPLGRWWCKRHPKYIIWTLNTHTHTFITKPHSQYPCICQYIHTFIPTLYTSREATTYLQMQSRKIRYPSTSLEQSCATKNADNSKGKHFGGRGGCDSGGMAREQGRHRVYILPLTSSRLSQFSTSARAARVHGGWDSVTAD